MGEKPEQELFGSAKVEKVTIPVEDAKSVNSNKDIC
jgi:hypothetical protein